jgi:hypothetical protein
MDADPITLALRRLQWRQETDSGVRVATHCLYPSNAAVRVLVQGQCSEFVVSDEGGAVEEVTSAGIAFADADKRMRSLVHRQGLLVEGGVIVSPRVPAEGLAAAILLVANVSKEAAHWGMTHLRPAAVGSFKDELDAIIRRFGEAEIHRSERIVGASNKQHSFEYALRPGKGKLLLIDPVYNDRSSISSKALAHLDVRNVGNDNIEQRIVYDDRVPWDAADLNLLRMGATPVPLSRLADVLQRLVA